MAKRSASLWSSIRRFGGALAAALLAFCASSAAAEPGPVPLTDADFPPVSQDAAALGRLLFFDRILSGNENISCADCHHHRLGSGDGLSLGVGEGGRGLGAERTLGEGETAVEHRVPRNAPALFNLGARGLQNLFYDGRVARDASQPSGFDTPFEDATPPGLDSLLAAQALAPLLARVEMAGAPHENAVALAADRERYADAWEILTERLRNVSGYPPLFAAAFDDVSQPQDMTIVHVANALAAFMAAEWRADQTPFDRFLRGEIAALPPEQARGMDLFFGEAGCAACHTGPLLTDQDFHAIAMPQIGPGKTPWFPGMATDMGRVLETGRLADAYRFRTPPLRNVAHTAPYGHAGAYAALEDVVRHHLDPTRAFETYELSAARLPAAARFAESDAQAMRDPRERRAILRANTLEPISLTEAQIADLLAFLRGALTDEGSLNGRLGPPEAVPSGFPVE